VSCSKESNCTRSCYKLSLACELAGSLATVHVHLQLRYTMPVQFVRFCYFTCTILLHHPRFSGNLHVTTIQLAITFMYITSVWMVYGCIACHTDCVSDIHTTNYATRRLTKGFNAVAWASAWWGNLFCSGGSKAYAQTMSCSITPVKSQFCTDMSTFLLRKNYS